MKFIFLFLSIVVITFDLKSQINIGDNLYVGGNGGFNATNNYSIFSVSPHLGYIIDNSLSVGARLAYQRTTAKITGIVFNSVGGGPFVRFSFNDFIFLQTEYEYLSFKVNSIFDNKIRQNYNSIFLGVGISQVLLGRSSFTILFLYNILYGDGVQTPYQSPYVIRTGFDIGFP